jgi:hypothetical protein
MCRRALVARSRKKRGSLGASSGRAHEYRRASDVARVAIGDDVTAARALLMAGAKEQDT